MKPPRHRTSISRRSLQTLFLREVLAAGAGIKAGRHSLETLTAMGREMRYCDFLDNLQKYFESLKPYRRFGDFQGMATLPTPSPLPLHVEPSILHGHFRAWLRCRKDGLKRKTRRSEKIEHGNLACWQ